MTGSRARRPLLLALALIAAAVGAGCGGDNDLPEVTTAEQAKAVLKDHGASSARCGAPRPQSWPCRALIDGQRLDCIVFRHPNSRAAIKSYVCEPQGLRVPAAAGPI